LGYTWAGNSSENRLTTWGNDPVSDQPHEVVYLRDEETAEIWTPTPLPVRADEPYLIRHGAGYTQYEHHSHGLNQHLKVFIAANDPIKVIQLRLQNAWPYTRRITVTYYAEWVLGTLREASQQFVIPEYSSEPQALLARNPYNIDFGERVAFAAANKPLHGLTADRTEFLGRLGGPAHPAALGRIGLSGEVRAGVDPCAALQLHVDLQPGASEEVYFILGQGKNREEALDLVRQYQDPQKVSTAWQETIKLWDGILTTIQVKTPEPALDLLLNRWLLYQTLSCRIWGRTAFYQSGGAYGFRDQLQDVLAMVYSQPEIARQQLLRSARHQFDAGDVLHWWHPPSGRGIRTRFSDDLLWLPYVMTHYLALTGDTKILDEQEPFLYGPLLEPGEEERYGQYPETKDSFSLYEHCRRAIMKGKTSGPHGLPLMKSGDWNDGMNRVGIDGKGESVWLAWFMYDTLIRFAAVCDQRGESEIAEKYRQEAQKLSQDIEASAWDGKWYLRAWYDNETPLGSIRDLECKIDSIAQSWSVISGAGNPERSLQALQSVQSWLVRTNPGLILLFTPPFDQTPHDPGYIKGYLPGVRENGGQYTHAALWTVWATAERGLSEDAWKLFRLLIPIYHADTPAKTAVYKVEPYVVAADIYSMPPHVGRGGWTWYTGSSGWMYRLGLERMLGFILAGDTLRLDPSIPKDWKSYQITYRHGEASYQITIENPQGVNRGVAQVYLDGNLVEDGVVHFAPSGEHEVRIILGPTRI
jgi:cyclic beta-1,2-glucan synthetase